MFLWERATGAVTLVSHTPGAPAGVGNSRSTAPTISADGAFVAFLYQATNLVAGQTDTNGDADIFLYARASGAVALVSHAAGSATSTGAQSSFNPSISGDGRFVVFGSIADNLLSAGVDTNGTGDIFIYARDTGIVTAVSHAPGGASTAGAGVYDAPSISADGSFIAFSSNSPNLVSGLSNNGQYQVFMFARGSGAVSLVSRLPGSATAGGLGESRMPVISADRAPSRSNRPRLTSCSISPGRGGSTSSCSPRATGSNSCPTPFRAPHPPATVRAG